MKGFGEKRAEGCLSSTREFVDLFTIAHEKGNQTQQRQTRLLQHARTIQLAHHQKKHETQLSKPPLNSLARCDYSKAHTSLQRQQHVPESIVHNIRSIRLRDDG